MVNFRNLVQKNRRICNVIFIVSLLLLPLININQGLDITDSTYSLGNYLFFDRLEGVWVLSTYLSNLLGALIVRLPYGNMLIGANFYTGLIVGLIAVLAYVMFSKSLGCEIAFVAEALALCYCWIPSGILYNYLSYFLMVIGVWFLMTAINSEKKYLLILAGIVFGLNIFVRIPNVTQMAFIVVLWTAAVIKKESTIKCLKDTLLCICGYIIGMCIPLILIVIQYGIDDVGVMIEGLSGITKTDNTYAPSSMIMDTISAYVHSAKWIAVIIGVVFVGTCIFLLGKDKFVKLKSVVFFFIIAIMLRVLWGRGMYSFRYYEDYSSMYEWGMVALYLSLIVCVYVLISNKFSVEIKLLSVASLITIIIAPLGSNNYTYQNLNNMFLVLPLTIYVVFYLIRDAVSKPSQIYTIPVVYMLLTLVLCITIQGVGFHTNFVFRDGTRGEKRDTKVENVDSLKGIYTSSDKVKSISELSDYIESIDVNEAIYFGDCPGLAYVLGVPSAISTTWPDLDSFPVEQFQREVNDNDNPIIIREEKLEYINSKMKYEGLEIILRTKYDLTFSNDEFKVYTVRR